MISFGKYSGSIKLVASSLSYFFFQLRLQIMWNTFNHKYVIGMCCDHESVAVSANQLPTSVRWGTGGVLLHDHNIISHTHAIIKRLFLISCLIYHTKISYIGMWYPPKNKI